MDWLQVRALFGLKMVKLYKVKKKLFLKNVNIIYSNSAHKVLPSSFKHKNFYLSTDILQKQFFKTIKVVNIKG